MSWQSEVLRLAHKARKASSTGQDAVETLARMAKVGVPALLDPLTDVVRHWISTNPATGSSSNGQIMDMQTACISSLAKLCHHLGMTFHLTASLASIWPDVEAFAEALFHGFLDAESPDDSSLLPLLHATISLITTHFRQSESGSYPSPEFMQETISLFDADATLYRLWTKLASRKDLILLNPELFKFTTFTYVEAMAASKDPAHARYFHHLPQDVFLAAFKNGIELLSRDGLKDRYPMLEFWSISLRYSVENRRVFFGNRGAHWIAYIFRCSMAYLDQLSGASGVDSVQLHGIATNACHARSCFPRDDLVSPYGLVWVEQALREDIIRSLFLAEVRLDREPFNMRDEDTTVAVLHAISLYSCFPTHYRLTLRGILRMKDLAESAGQKANGSNRKKTRDAWDALFTEVDGLRTLVLYSGAKEPRCGRETCQETGQFQECSHCGTIRYCSRECQKKDWKAHRDVCIEAAAGLSRGEPALWNPKHWELQRLMGIFTIDAGLHLEHYKRLCKTEGLDIREVVLCVDYSEFPRLYTVQQRNMHAPVCHTDDFVILARMPLSATREDAKKGRGVETSYPIAENVLLLVQWRLKLGM